MAADGRIADWSAARLEVGLSDMRCHRGRHGRCRRTEGRLDARLGQHAVVAQGAPRHAGAGRPGDSLGPLQPYAGRQRQARSRAAGTAHRGDTVVALAGAELHRPLAPQSDRRQGRLSRPLVGVALGRPYGQLWDSASRATNPAPDDGPDRIGLRRHPADAGRRLSRDRSGDQVRHHVHRPHLRGLPAVRDGDRHAPACRAVRPDRPRALRLLPAAAVDRRAGRFRAGLRRERLGRRRPGHAVQLGAAAPRRPRPRLRRHPRRPLCRTVRPAAARGRRPADRLGAAVRRAVGGDVAHPQHPSGRSRHKRTKRRGRPTGRPLAFHRARRNDAASFRRIVCACLFLPRCSPSRPRPPSARGRSTSTTGPTISPRTS